MLIEPTQEKLRELSLLGMLKAYEEQLSSNAFKKMSFDERLGLMVEREAELRENKRLSSRLKKARLRQQACIADINYKEDRKLNKALILKLASCQWIKDHLNVLITGSTGAGKSYIACALSHKACLEGFSCQYVRVGRLFQALEVAKGDGRYMKMMSALHKVDLLVLDDWGLSKLTDSERRDLLEILEDRYELKSTIITSQLPVKKWHEVIGDPTLADAILDRVVHNSYRIEIEGKNSMRDKKSTKEKGGSAESRSKGAKSTK